ncbi:MAG: right-handed parallel beta-helix repeat-containing protein [Candidatus Margulisiibacteriota bacterium]
MKKIIALVIGFLLIPSIVLGLTYTVNYKATGTEYKSLRYMVALANSSGKESTVYLPHNSNDASTYYELADVDCNIPVKIKLRIDPGAILKLTGSGNAYIYNFENPGEMQQVFYEDPNATGHIYFRSGSSQKVVPQWWGAKGDGSTDDLQAFKAATYAMGTTGSRVFMVPFTGWGYKLSDQWEITRGNLGLILNDDITSSNTDPNHLIYIHGTSGAGNHLENIKMVGSKITIDGNGNNVSGYSYPGGAYDTMRLDYADNIHVEGIHFTNGLHNSLSLVHAHGYNVVDCEFSNSQYENGFTAAYEYIGFAPYDLSLCANASVVSCRAHDNSDFGFTSICATHVFFTNCFSWDNGGGYSAELVTGDRDIYVHFKNCKAVNNIGRAWFITADEVVLENCFAYGDGSSAADSEYTTRSGIYAYAALNLRLINCEIANFTHYGIRTRGFNGDQFTTVTIDNCHIHDCDMGGIGLKGMDRAIIKGAEVHDTGRAISIDNSVVNFNTGEGIADIQNCHIYENGYWGIKCDSIATAIILNNVIRDCPNSSSDIQSIKIDTVDNSYVFNNNIIVEDSVDVDWGIYVVGAGNLYQGNNRISSSVNSGELYQDGTVALLGSDLSLTRENALKWAHRITNLNNSATTGYGTGLQFKMSAPSDTNKWAGIAGEAESAYATVVGLQFFTANTGVPTSKMKITGGGYVGIGKSDPATRLCLYETKTITGATSDGYSGGMTIDPNYAAATALTVTRHNYLDLHDIENFGAGPSAVTDACVMRFDADAGTHKAVGGAGVKATTSAYDFKVKVNINGTVGYLLGYFDPNN